MNRVFAAVGVAVVALATSGASTSTPAVSAAALRSYLHTVEPIRLGVNRLLEGADPILAAYRQQRLTGDQAAAAMDTLERRFADYTVRIAAIHPPISALAGLHSPYAHTYVFEDAYLSALVAALPGGDFSQLPNTQAAQRATIIEWRTQLEVLARTTGVHLPSDLQQAGRGEIAPAVSGTS